MNKTIVIGVGGTGLEIIRCLRRRVVENRGSLDAAPNLGFFYIDTDDRDVKLTADTKKRWEILGTSVALSPAEYYMIPAPDFGALQRNLAAFPIVREWLPVEELKVLDQTDKQSAGARQIRPLGRLGFTLALQEIETAVKNSVNRVPAPRQGGRTQIYVACSLSGGTGSGIFLDLAYRLKEWINETHETHAFLVSPDLQANRDARYVPNAYAALMELNYFSLAGQTVRDGTDRIVFQMPGGKPVNDKPYDFCYIVGTRNRENVNISLSGVANMIAHRIYLSFDSSFAEDARTLLNNGGAERAMPYTDEVNGNKHSRNFFTFGLSAIEYPVEQMQEIIAWRMAGALFNSWVGLRELEGNISEQVQNLISQLKLSDEYLHADLSVFAAGGANMNFGDYRVQVRSEVEQMVAQAPDTNQTAYFTERVKGFLTGYRNRGVVGFYQDRISDAGGAVQEIMRQIRPRVNAYIVNPKLGYEHAVRWLDEVLRYLTDRRGVLAAEWQGEETRKENAPSTIDRGYADLSGAEEKWFFREEQSRTRAMWCAIHSRFISPQWWPPRPSLMRWPSSMA